ncbi:hypothetical protein GWL_33390 [Herbaspirillum sp. GW103]|nr:hypothetical protein GWL_33390 [Herbaspirillum sp. GW103]
MRQHSFLPLFPSAPSLAGRPPGFVASRHSGVNQENPCSFQAKNAELIIEFF